MKNDHFWQDFSSKASLLEASLGASWATQLGMQSETCLEGVDHFSKSLAENDHAFKNIMLSCSN